jgi:hypothetical protein
LLSHPFHDEAVKWMGHPDFATGLELGWLRGVVSHPGLGHGGSRRPVEVVISHPGLRGSFCRGWGWDGYGVGDLRVFECLHRFFAVLAAGIELGDFLIVATGGGQVAKMAFAFG